MILEIIESITCKYCGLSSVSRCGSYNHVPRYLCKSCGRKFKVDNNLFYMRVPAEIVYSSLDMYYQGVQMKDIRTVLKREYGYSPSRAAIYKWIRKFTDKAISYFHNYSPATGDIWIVGEYIEKMEGKRMKIYEIVDVRSGFLLATCLTPNRSITTIKKLLKQAVRKAGKSPGTMYAFINYSYFDKIKSIFKCQVEHISMQPQEMKWNIELVDCMLNIYDNRFKIMGRVKSLDMINRLLDGWNVHYNYFQKQSKLGNNTPAEAAGLNYPIKSWKDLIILRSMVR